MIEKFNQLLQAYKIKGEVAKIIDSPLTLTMAVKLELGQKIPVALKLADAVSLHFAQTCRSYIEDGHILYELPKTKREILSVDSISFSEGIIPIALGKTVHNKDLGFDLSTLPHLLVAGTTGSGKSVCLDSIISQAIDACHMILIDPKRVEFAAYKDRVEKYATDPKDAVNILDLAVQQMDYRYNLFEQKGVKNLQEFNRKTGFNYKPIVIVIDELADLMMQSKDLREVTETSIIRLAQLARAAGIHLVVATQRPSVDVVTGLIRSNLPAKIAFRVAKKPDSRIILDQVGAEALTGKGDGLFLCPKTSNLIRFQCAMPT